MKKLIALLAFALPLCAQQQINWMATSGNVSQTGSSYTFTIQQIAQGAQLFIDKVVIYSSVASIWSQSANGTPATATQLTQSAACTAPNACFTPLLPSSLTQQLPFTVWTNSNVGAGQQQAGVINLPAGATMILCQGTSCLNNGQITVPNGSTSSNYSITVNGVTGTSNITVYGRIE